MRHLPFFLAVGLFAILPHRAMGQSTSPFRIALESPLSPSSSRTIEDRYGFERVWRTPGARAPSVVAHVERPPTTPVPATKPGVMRCEARENGIPATASFEAIGPTRTEGRCGASLDLPAGRYRITVRLLTAPNVPPSTHMLDVAAGAMNSFVARFATATLALRIDADGRAVPGRGRIYRDGALVARVGSGHSVVLPPGRYRVDSRISAGHLAEGGSRVVDVNLAAGQRRMVHARF